MLAKKLSLIVLLVVFLLTWQARAGDEKATIVARRGDGTGKSYDMSPHSYYSEELEASLRREPTKDAPELFHDAPDMTIEVTRGGKTEKLLVKGGVWLVDAAGAKRFFPMGVHVQGQLEIFTRFTAAANALDAEGKESSPRVVVKLDGRERTLSGPLHALFLSELARAEKAGAMKCDCAAPVMSVLEITVGEGAEARTFETTSFYLLEKKQSRQWTFWFGDLLERLF